MPSDVSAPLPDLDLKDTSTITIDTGDASAIITQVVIHVRADIPVPAESFQVLPPLLAFGAESV